VNTYSHPAIAFDLHHGHVFVPVAVGGRTASFILDTGASASVVSMALAESLAVPLGAAITALGAGDGTVAGAMLGEPLTICVAGTCGEGAIGVALPLQDLAAREGRRIDGILGADFIARWILDIDYPAREFRVHDPAVFTHTGRGARLPLSFRIGHPHVEARLEIAPGVLVPVDCLVDLGSARSLALAKPFIEAHDLRAALAPLTPADTGAGVGGDLVYDLAHAHALHLGEIVIASPEVALFGAGAGVFTTGEYFEGNIGAGLLHAFRVVLDYGRSLLVLERG